MRFELASGSHLQGNASLQLNETWRENPAQLPLQAKLVLALKDLKLLPVLIDPLEDTEGSIDGELTVTGNLAAPQPTGQLRRWTTAN